MNRTLALTAAAALLALAVPQSGNAGGPKHCPPGLAKKGCVPPGQAKKRYEVGHPLPSDVYYRPVEWQGRYRAPPPGTFYGQVDGDLLLIAEGTRKVVELIGIANALSN